MSEDALEKPRRGVRQVEITRLIRAAQAAGLTVNRIEIVGTKVTVFTVPETAAEQTVLQQWRAKKTLVY